MVTVKQMQHSRMTWAAAAVGATGTLAEAFIGTATLLSGNSMGWYDIVGTVLGVVALLLVWRHPQAAALMWLLTPLLLFNGGLLVSVACLPILLVPVAAAATALFAWRLERRA